MQYCMSNATLLISTSSLYGSCVSQWWSQRSKVAPGSRWVGLNRLWHRGSDFHSTLPICDWVCSDLHDHGRRLFLVCSQLWRLFRIVKVQRRRHRRPISWCCHHIYGAECVLLAVAENRTMEDFANCHCNGESLWWLLPGRDWRGWWTAFACLVYRWDDCWHTRKFFLLGPCLLTSHRVN